MEFTLSFTHDIYLAGGNFNFSGPRDWVMDDW